MKNFLKRSLNPYCSVINLMYWYPSWKFSIGSKGRHIICRFIFLAQKFDLKRLLLRRNKSFFRTVVKPATVQSCFRKTFMDGMTKSRIKICNYFALFKWHHVFIYEFEYRLITQWRSSRHENVANRKYLSIKDNQIIENNRMGHI